MPANSCGARLWFGFEPRRHKRPAKIRLATEFTELGHRGHRVRHRRRRLSGRGRHAGDEGSMRNNVAHGASGVNELLGRPDLCDLCVLRVRDLTIGAKTRSTTDFADGADGKSQAIPPLEKGPSSRAWSLTRPSVPFASGVGEPMWKSGNQERAETVLQFDFAPFADSRDTECDQMDCRVLRRRRTSRNDNGGR